MSCVLVVWLWVTSRHVLLSDAEIDRAIPPELRWSPPSQSESDAVSALTELNREIGGRPIFEPKKFFLSAFFNEPIPYAYASIAASDDLPEKVERLCDLGPPGEGEVFKGDVSTRFSALFHAFWRRVELLPKREPRSVWSSVRALARLTRNSVLYRGSANQYLTDFASNAQQSLGVILRAVDAQMLSPRQLAELDRILPTDEQIIAAGRARAAFDYQLTTVNLLRPPAVEALLRAPEPQASGDPRYMTGRLNVPATLRREATLIERYMESLGRPESARSQKRSSIEAERFRFLGSRPFPDDDEATAVVLARDLFFRIRARAEPNARGWYVGIPSFERWLDAAFLEREIFAVAHAKLRVKAGLGAPLPLDPADGKPLRTDPQRRWVLSAGRSGPRLSTEPPLVHAPGLVESYR
ncbi:hypothetical protein [Fimbriimonas ginsengisoli]|uniref:hypothetical protein n=1 Tax=Fimbriimonas ginsengisoli TaxID=1005039 RepID=UPI0011871E0C|nr:hypothetical protein [Fimbriimonas ginsengisoli]